MKKKCHVGLLLRVILVDKDIKPVELAVVWAGTGIFLKLICVKSMQSRVWF